MKIAICDNSIEDIKKLHKCISEHEKYNIFDVLEFTSPTMLLDEISKGKRFDIIFLDVDMPDINGIELGKRIRSFLEKSFIIFVTNYPQYALDAYDCAAYHYLIKPIDTKKLHSTLEKIITNYVNKNAEYIIRGRFENVRVLVNDILYVEYFRKHVCFHIDGPKREQYEVIGNLTEIYDKFKPLGFFRCHQAFIVNLEKINKFDGYNAILVNGETIPISVRNKTDLVIAYTNYHERIT